ncbi:hypothetical protein M3936_03080 [Sutcliffiella horikoshii]|uniref:hypothetical protein n=1 Tax=Sutcliffiella horikoshii TaxID=79883 RepID=UPI00204026F5|nr:hypothetical protein [Sutcliffiella horikoshii]MCM3616558.1 hypothetical protein [Sutcliffiella horikoshii]
MVGIEQYKTSYAFAPYEDLRFKHQIFNAELGRVRTINDELASIINAELEVNEGKVIEQSLMEFNKNHRLFTIITNDQSRLMVTLSNKYHEHVTEMNRQELTIFYEDLEKNSD